MTVEPHEQFVTLQHAAEILGVHYMTAYRWVREGRLPAYKVGGRIRVDRAEINHFAREQRVEIAVRPGGTGGRTDWPRHVDNFHHLLLEGRSDDARSLARRLMLDGATASEVYTLLLTPALHRIGDDWAAGRITATDEHRATAIVSAVVAVLSHAFRRRGASRGAAATVSMAGDRHELAPAMVADHARAAGFTVHHLGCDLPAIDVEQFLRSTPVDVLLVSVTTPAEPAAYGEMVLAAQAAGTALVMFGGQSADQNLIERAGGEYIAEITQLVSRLEGVRASRS